MISFSEMKPAGRISLLAEVPVLTIAGFNAHQRLSLVLDDLENDK